jgi:hypothetical protein
VVDPGAHARGDLGGRSSARDFDVDHRRQVAGLGRADGREQQIGLRDRVLGGPEELVRAADHAGGLRAGPVRRELRVGELQAIADAHEREVDPGVVRGGPVDAGLVVRDVHAVDGGAIAAHRGGLLDGAELARLGAADQRRA